MYSLAPPSQGSRLNLPTPQRSFLISRKIYDALCARKVLAHLPPFILSSFNWRGSLSPPSGALFSDLGGPGPAIVVLLVLAAKFVYFFLSLFYELRSIVFLGFQACNLLGVTCWSGAGLADSAIGHGKEATFA